MLQKHCDKPSLRPLATSPQTCSLSTYAGAFGPDKAPDRRQCFVQKVLGFVAKVAIVLRKYDAKEVAIVLKKI